MNKRPLFCCCVLLILGIAAGMSCGWLKAAAAAGAAGILLWKRPAARNSGRRDLTSFRGLPPERQKSPPGGTGMYVLLLLGIFLLGTLRGNQAFDIRRLWERELFPGQEVEVRGTLAMKEQKDRQIRYYLNVTSLCADGAEISCSTVILYPESDDISIGTEIWAKAIVSDGLEARNEGNFDQREADNSQHIACRLKQIRWLSCCPPSNPWRQRLYEVRLGIKKIYESHLPGEEAGVLAAMTLGDKTDLTEEVKDLYRQSGLSHILAVSGLHISILCMGLYRFLRRRGIGFGVCFAVSGSVAIVFGCFCGNSVGTRRAVGMFLIYLAAEWMGRAYDSLTALGVMGVLLLWERPLLLCNSGFVFSFGAAFGVVVFAAPLQKAVEACWHDAKGMLQDAVRRTAGALASAAGIWIFTLPIVAYYYYEIPPYAIWLNVCLLPLLPALLTLGLLGGALGMAAGFFAARGVLSETVGFLAKMCFYPCHLLLYGYEMAADTANRLSMSAVVVGRPHAWQILLYYLVLYLLFRRLVSRSEASLCAAEETDNLAAPGRKDKRSASSGRKRLRAAAAAAALLLNVLVLFRQETGFEIDMLDVGQGDGIFVQSREGVTFFIDGGSTDESRVGRYRILPFLKYKGIGRVDYWFVSHTDADHINGLAECLESGYDIGTIVFAQYMERDAAYGKIAALASCAGAGISHMKAGDRCGTNTLTWTCLGPDASADVQDANASSLILQLECGDFRGLFTGDIGIRQEEELVRGGRLSRVDVLKAAHHGSDNSNSRLLLETCRPSVAVISCGADNRYGHPGKDALGRMEDAGVGWYCTAICGRIRIRMLRDGICVEGYVE